MKPLGTWFKKAVSFQGALRLLADAILINLAILISLVARLLWIVATSMPGVTLNYRVIFWDYWGVYTNNAWLLTLISLSIFILNGFYTYGRFYRGRYKVLIVIQAVSLAYIIFGFLTYLAQSNFVGILSRLLNFPRGTLIVSWALSVAMLVVARLWATIWKIVIKTESSRSRQAEGRSVKNVLVIGGAGYIGSALLPRLLDKGYNVRLLDLLLYGTDPIKEWLNHPHLEILRADFRQVEKVVQAMHGMDAVIHLGGLVGDSACALNEELTLEINLMATRMIAEVAKGSGVGRFIFTSTCSVYGANDQMLDERSELRPVSLYARSKIASEKVLQKLADDSFAPIILRLSTIYGLSGRPRFDLVINLLTAKAVVDHEITIFGGDQWRPFMHVDDAARAIASVLEAPLQIVRNHIFNVGSNEQNYKISQVGEIIHGLVPGAAVVNKDDISDTRNYWVNSNKINQVLGFSPEWSVEQGVKQVIEAISSGKVSDYRDARYSNIKFLKEEGIYLLANNESNGDLNLLNEESFSALVQDEG
jgi:nucleoside-diphosphate-sugar epimerase